MRTTSIAAIITAAATTASAQLVVEDLTDGGFDAPEFVFDFGTSDDATGFPNGDFNSFDSSGLILATDRIFITFALNPGEFVDFVEVQFSDFTGGPDDFIIDVFSDAFVGTPAATFEDTEPPVVMSETRSYTAAPGEAITGVNIFAFEGVVESITINIVPAAPTAALLPVGLALASRRRR